jgi:hypothetical protein
MSWRLIEYNVNINFTFTTSNHLHLFILTASVVWWSEFLAANVEVSGSISGATRFSEKW